MIPTQTVRTRGRPHRGRRRPSPQISARWRAPPRPSPTSVRTPNSGSTTGDSRDPPGERPPRDAGTNLDGVGESCQDPALARAAPRERAALLSGGETRGRRSRSAAPGHRALALRSEDLRRGKLSHPGGVDGAREIGVPNRGAGAADEPKLLERGRRLPYLGEQLLLE